jgi:hypothetical protein
MRLCSTSESTAQLSVARQRDLKLNCSLCHVLQQCCACNCITGHPAIGIQQPQRSLQQQNNSTPAVGGGSVVGNPALQQPPTNPGTAVGSGSAVNNPGAPAPETNPDIAVGHGASVNQMSPMPTGAPAGNAGGLTKQLPWLVCCWAVAALAGWVL